MIKGEKMSDINEAHKAFNSKDYTKARELYTILAENKDKVAQTSLGYIYQQGLGTPKDEAKALALYKAAAEQKEPIALFNMGILYANGLGGVEHNQFLAHQHFLEAAIREVVPAMYEVALMFERGLGCESSFSEAAFWYEEGAKRGDAKCFNNLGVLYKDGIGVEQNYQKAFVCFSRAAEAELPEGLYNLGLMYDQGLGCQEDHDKALEYARKAAYKGHEKAKAIIKTLQEEGKIVF